MGVNMTVACGRCVGCRINRATDWAIRMSHESQMHPTNCTLTLTYAPEHLPENGTLVPDHHARFIHELRRKTGRKIRYFHCGEYGGEHGRPHYHTALFGFDAEDKRPGGTSKKGHPLWRSDFLNEVWGKGHVHVGSLSFSSARYIAKYAIKSVNVERADGPDQRAAFDRRYERVNPSTGELVNVTPEYVTMSRRPGLGYTWFMRFKNDLYNHDYAVANGKRHPVPDYYDRKLEEYFPEEWEDVKKRRREKREYLERDPMRLAQMEVCARAKNYSHMEFRR